MSKLTKASFTDWDSLIKAVSRDLELARVRVKQLKSVVGTFKDRRRKREPFPGADGGAAR